MILKTKRVDNKHVIVLEAPDHLLDKLQAGIGDLRDADIYMAKRLASGGLERIPEDEPTITFRGRDKLALPMLHGYRRLCEADSCNSHQLEVLDGMIREFENFLIGHPDRMKQPGITRG